ncbi:23536_t:CDS:2 [Gigaspora margarita]|uniref:23536_t:CDS:1 n=1 Tax=Gigaspora margarita TaxID=4874 RepID=A0ABM8W6R0_GIGMA|nr:23536_t:CDS:2 [Gigaspora margarita]
MGSKINCICLSYQHIEITEDQTLFKNVQDQTQHIETIKNRIQEQTQNIELTKNRTTNIFKFHNSGNIKLYLSSE